MRFGGAFFCYPQMSQITQIWVGGRVRLTAGFRFVPCGCLDDKSVVCHAQSLLVWHDFMGRFGFIRKCTPMTQIEA